MLLRLVFDEIRKWSDTHKQDFIPVRILRDKPKEALSDLEKQELHKKEEDWFDKKFELELALDAKKAAQETSKPQAVKLQKYLITPLWWPRTAIRNFLDNSRKFNFCNRLILKLLHFFSIKKILKMYFLFFKDNLFLKRLNSFDF